MVIPTAIIVDDEPGIAELFSGLLELQKVKIVGIGYTGIDAIRLVNAKTPDIAFLDINMPKMSGIDALKEIVKNNSTTKVVMMTGDESVEEEPLKEIGAIALVSKPFNTQQIMEALEKINRSLITFG